MNQLDNKFKSITNSVSTALSGLFKAEDFSLTTTFSKRENILISREYDKEYKTNTFTVKFNENVSPIKLLQYFIIGSNMEYEEFKELVLQNNVSDDFKMKFENQYNPYSEYTFNRPDFVEWEIPSPMKALTLFLKTDYEKKLGTNLELVDKIISSKLFRKPFSELETWLGFDVKGIFKKIIVISPSKIEKMTAKEIVDTINTITSFEKISDKVSFKFDKNEEVSMNKLEQIKDEKYISEIYKMLKSKRFFDEEQFTYEQKLEEKADLFNKKAELLNEYEKNNSKLFKFVTASPFFDIFDKTIQTKKDLENFKASNKEIVSALQTKANEFELFVELKSKQIESLEKLNEIFDKIQAFEDTFNNEVFELNQKTTIVNDFVSKYEQILPLLKNFTKEDNEFNTFKNKDEFYKFLDKTILETQTMHSKTGKFINSFDIDYTKQIVKYANAKSEINFFTNLKIFIESNYQDDNALEQMKMNFGKLKIVQIENNNFLKYERTNSKILSYFPQTKDKLSYELISSFTNKETVSACLLVEKIKVDKESIGGNYDEHNKNFVQEINDEIKECQMILDAKTGISFIDKNDFYEIKSNKLEQATKIIDILGGYDKARSFLPIFEKITEWKNDRDEFKFDYDKSFKEALDVYQEELDASKYETKIEDYE